jgi:hypothetical protein
MPAFSPTGGNASYISCHTEPTSWDHRGPTKIPLVYTSNEQEKVRFQGVNEFLSNPEAGTFPYAALGVPAIPRYPGEDKSASQSVAGGPFNASVARNYLVSMVRALLVLCDEFLTR